MRHVKKIIKVTGGVVVLCIGILGIFLPIIPGLLFIALGLFWLGIVEKDDLKRAVQRFKQK